MFGSAIDAEPLLKPRVLHLGLSRTTLPRCYVHERSFFYGQVFRSAAETLRKYWR